MIFGKQIKRKGFIPLTVKLLVGLFSAIFLLSVSATAGSAANSFSPNFSYSTNLRRYPYLTDVVQSYATINWATDRSNSSGGVRWGKVGTESCTAHYQSATKVAITVNGVAEYQWKAMLNLSPGTQYCYRVYLGSSPTTEMDLLGTDPSPSFWTQVPSGSSQSYSFAVIGDWGYVDASGNNAYQANLMSLIAASGARFVVTTGDNGYPSGNQTNFGDLIQTGSNISAIFGPSFWKVPGASIPIFPSLGNHGFSSSDTNHPFLYTWPQDRAVSTSGGRYTKESYCCLNGTTSAMYPSAWYAFDAGKARFYVLDAAWADSNVGTATSYQNDYDYHWAPGSAEYQWLQADLASHSNNLKFAFFHYPIYTDNPNEASDTFLQGSNSLEGLLKQYGVDIAFTGHAHIYERNLPSPTGLVNYVTGGGGATIGTLGTCTALDAYAIKFTTTGKACGSAPVPTSAGQVYHFLLVTVNGSGVTVAPTNSLGQTFDVMNYNFSVADTTPPTVPANLNATAVSGTQINLSWSASSDNTGVSGYSIYRNGVLVGTVDAAALTYSDFNLVPATSYTYKVDAFDGAGNHSAQSAPASATTSNTGTYSFTPIGDAYVAGDFTTTNYGLATTLRADASPDYRSYLRFNVNGLNGTVTNATLRLYTTSSSSTGYQVRSVTDQTWEENLVTYANAPAIGPVINSSGNIASGTWTSVDVTSLITGNGTFDLALTTTTSTALNFSSRDAITNWPELVIQTSVPLGTPNATGTPSNTLTYAPEADARVAEASPTTNYGAQTNLQASAGSGAGQTSYIRFTTSGITGPIQSAKLRVYCTTNGTANGPAVYLANNTWVESGSGGVTWDTQPGLLSGANDNKGAIAASSWVEYDVTALVSGNGTYTFALVADGTDGVTFSSREGTSPPQLVVILNPLTVTPANTATLTPTATGTGAATLTPTPTPSTNTLTYTTGADARVSEGSPTSNYGTATTLRSDGGAGVGYASYIRFTTSGITGSIQSAKLRVFCTTNGTANGPAAYLANSNWVESGSGGVTWNTQPGLLSGANDNKGAIAANSWVEYDVTTLVSGNGTYTFALMADASDGVTFSSREGGTAPQLVVVFASPTATPSLTPTPSETPTATDTGTPTATETATVTPTDTPAVTDTGTPTATDTATVTPTDTAVVTDTGTPTPSETPLVTDTGTPTATETATIPTDTPMVTDTVTPTPSDTPTATETGTPTVTRTATPTPSDTPEVTDTVTPTPSDTPTATETGTPTVTRTATPTPSDTPEVTDTVTPTPSDTPIATHTSTITATPIPTPTDTPLVADTETPTPTDTPLVVDNETPTPTDTPLVADTETPTPTDTPLVIDDATPTPTDTPVVNDTETPTPTDTPLVFDTATPTPTSEPMVTEASIPTSTDTATITPTPTWTLTPTPIATSTNIPTATSTTTVTLTPTRTLTPTPLVTNTSSPTATITASVTPTRTPTFSPTTLTFAPLADTRVAEAAPTTNYGTQTNLQSDMGTGVGQISYIRFTTSGITGPIQSVKLRVFCTTNGTANGPAAYLANSNWVESGSGGVTWNTRPGLLSGANDNKGAIATNTWVEYNVTALVSGNGTYTFALVADGSDGVTFSSREGTSDPQLVVVFGP